MKNRFLTFIIAVIIILPSIVALSNYIIMKDSPVSSSSVTEGSLIVPTNGGESEPYELKDTGNKLDLNNIDSNLLEFFTDVTTSSEKVSGLPDSVSGEAYYTLTLTNYNRPIEYKYYFTERADHCYFLDEEGSCYLIPQEYARAFLVSRYAMSIYDASTIPTLTTPAGEPILYDTLIWKYRTVDEVSYSQLKDSKENANSDMVYTIAQKLNLAFDIAPGSTTVNISANGETIYNGLLESAAYQDIPGNQTLDVSITAKWYETEERKSEGEITYNFKCIISDAPVFQVTYNSEDTEVNAGDFICVTAKNIINNAADITFTSSPSIGEKPTFYKDGIVYRALIPTSPETEPGTYTLTFSADGTEQSIDVTVKPNPYACDPLAENIPSDKLTAATESEFAANMKEIFENSSETRYFDGGFDYPIAGGSSTIKSGYGRTFETNGGYRYLNNWVRLYATAGTEVMAMNSGVIVYADEETMTGRTIVVDHGMGLMTVYANLSSIDVSVGDEVKSGDVIGKTGDTGYTDGARFSFAMTVNGKFVCPYQILDENGVVFAK